MAIYTRVRYAVANAPYSRYLVSAVKAQRKIVVEVKSFIGQSDIKDLEQAVGQYVIYRQILDKTVPDYKLYLAVTTNAFRNVFETELGTLLLVNQIIRVLVFEPKEEIITQWIPN